MTNLRLPGQYDERLLGSVGLQGPYYNWNRWYLPGVGRYLDLDPIATAAAFNRANGPDWYSYGSGNPLSYSDPWGLLDCHPGESTVVCKCRLDPSVCTLVPPQTPSNLPWWLRWLAPLPLPFLPSDDPPPPPPPRPPPPPDTCKDDPKDCCWEQCVKCASGRLGGMPPNQFGYSQCTVCQEECIQNGGVWPTRARNGKPCQ